MAFRVCKKCGNQAVPQDAKFCGQCGTVAEIGAKTLVDPPQNVTVPRPPQAGAPTAGPAQGSATAQAVPVPIPPLTPLTPLTPLPSPDPKAPAPTPTPSPGLVTAPPAPDTPVMPSGKSAERTMMEFAVPPALATPKPDSSGASTKGNTQRPPPLPDQGAAGLGAAGTPVRRGVLPVGTGIALVGGPKKTMLGVASDATTPEPPPAAPGFKNTVMGMPAAEVPPPPGLGPHTKTVKIPPSASSPAAAAAASPLPGAAVPPPPATPTPRSAAGTMMGMPAVPMMAPGGGPEAPHPGMMPPASTQQPRQAVGTMMGVAMPGIAPLHAGIPQAPASPMPVSPRMPPAPRPPGVDIVPAPPPLLDVEAPPAAPVVVRRKGGVPIGVVGGLGLTLILLGALVFWLATRATVMVATPRLDADGKDVLHLSCPDCKDGTTAKLNESIATFKGHEADLPLVVPLKVGTNPLVLAIDRPGFGRDEDLKLAVPLVYRIRPDLSTLNDPVPTLTVRVEALPGTAVTLDGKPLALAADGTAAYTVDLSADTQGPSDESHYVSKSIPYVVTPKGDKPQTGTVSARVAVVPLRVDTPTSHAIVTTPSFVVSGRAAKGTSVTINGADVPLAADGYFETTLPSTTAGSVPVDVRASGTSYAPRVAHLDVRRVDKLENATQAYETAGAPGYDAVNADVAASVGQLFVVDGEVKSSRVQRHRTVAVASDRRGCAGALAHPPTGECLVSVVIGHEETLNPGDPIRVYGRVARAVTDHGKSVPEIEADFILKGRH